MRIMFQALQAVTVELSGIVLFLWLLFGCASWGIRTSTADRDDANQQFSTLLNSASSQLTEIVPQSPVQSTLGFFKRT
jgi:hypothetical protein